MRHDTWMTSVLGTQRCAILSLATLEPRVYASCNVIMLCNSVFAVFVGVLFTLRVGWLSRMDTSSTAAELVNLVSIKPMPYKPARRAKVSLEGWEEGVCVRVHVKVAAQLPVRQKAHTPRTRRITSVHGTSAQPHAASLRPLFFGTAVAAWLSTPPQKLSCARVRAPRSQTADSKLVLSLPDCRRLSSLYFASRPPRRPWHGLSFRFT